MKYSLLNKMILALFLKTLFLSYCSRPSQIETELREILNTPLEIELFEAVLYNDTVSPFQQFRNKYDFITVVYLQDGCNPCYPKFVEWHQKMEEMNEIKGHTILFVIQTQEYEDFISKVRQIGKEINEKYYVVIDPDHKFFTSNNHIPDWIINSSILIDRENKIKMVGAPWLNEDMKELFYKTMDNQ
jgi:hypothetical protein